MLRSSTCGQSSYVKGLDLQIFLNAELGSFTPYPRLLDTAEGRHLERDRAGVETDHTELESLRYAPGTVEVGRVEIRRQPARGRVGDLDRLLLVFEAEQRSDRTERFLVR